MESDIKKLIDKRKVISERINTLEIYVDNGLISENKFKKARLKLIAELHTLDFVLKDDILNLDSDVWFMDLID